jgi:hypothetical protein
VGGLPTFAATAANGEVAPIPAVHGTAMEPLGSDPKRPFNQAQLAHDHPQRGKGGVEAYQPRIAGEIDWEVGRGGWSYSSQFAGWQAEVRHQQL